MWRRDDYRCHNELETENEEHPGNTEYFRNEQPLLSFNWSPAEMALVSRVSVALMKTVVAETERAVGDVAKAVGLQPHPTPLSPFRYGFAFPSHEISSSSRPIGDELPGAPLVGRGNRWDVADTHMVSRLMSLCLARPSTCAVGCTSCLLIFVV